MDYKEILISVTKTIVDVIDSNLDKLTYDRTFKAKIVEVIQDGIYKIKYKGNIYKVKSFVDCVIDDYVTVCAPCNEWNELFVVRRNGFFNFRMLNEQVILNTGKITQIIEKSTKVKKYSFNINLVSGENISKIIFLDAGMGSRIMSVFIERAWPLTTWQNGAIVVINNYDISNDQLSVNFASSYAQTYAIRIGVIYN